MTAFFAIAAAAFGWQEPLNYSQLLYDYGVRHTVRGPFHNPWIHQSRGGGAGDGKNPRFITFTLDLTDGTTATARIDTRSGAITKFHTNWNDVPTYDPSIEKCVLKAHSLAEKDSGGRHLRLRFAFAGSSPTCHVIFADDDGYQFGYYLRRSDLRQDIPIPEALAKRGEVLLTKLGVPGPFHLMACGPVFSGPNPPPNPRMYSASVVAKDGVGYDTYFDGPSKQIVSIERWPRETSIVISKAKPAAGDAAIARKYLSVLGAATYQLQPPYKSGNSEFFDFRYVKNGLTFLRQYHGTVRFDALTHRVENYRATATHALPPMTSAKPKLSMSDAKRVVTKLLDEEMAEHKRGGLRGAWGYKLSGTPELGYYKLDFETTARVVWYQPFMRLSTDSEGSRGAGDAILIDAVTGERLNPGHIP